MVCENCKWKYPDNLLSQMFISAGTNGNGYTGQLCGICALAQVNKTHGTNETKFRGPMAEAMRKAAIHWRKTHISDSPDYQSYVENFPNNDPRD